MEPGLLTFSEDNRVACWPRHERSICGITGDDGHRIGIAEVRELASASRQPGTPFDVDKQARRGDEGSDEPHEQRKSDRSARFENGRRCSKNSGEKRLSLRDMTCSS